jgi:hypothetical protein
MRIFKRRPGLGSRLQRGQSMVEFTMVLPVILTLTLAIAEFGVAFGTNMTMIEATREGSRVGAILVDGSNSFGCPGYPGSANVDPQIVAAVQRAIESPGSGIKLSSVDFIEIFQADAAGNPVAGKINTWTPTSLGGGPLVCGVHLDFIQGTVGWNASVRANTLPVQAIGVRIQYRYRLFTPLAAVTGLFGLNQITMVDTTSMDFEP